MAAVAHPPETQQSLGPSPAQSPSCPQRQWAALLSEPPCGGGDEAPPAAPSSPAGAPLPGSRPGSTCARPYWIPCPSHCLRAGAAGREKGRAEPGFSPSPARSHGAELARGESQRDARENYNAQRLATLTSTGLGALPPRHTPPRSDTQKAAPAAAAGRNPRGPGAAGGREGGDPGRAGGRRAATEGAEGREGGGKMEPGPYLSTDCSFSSSFFCRSMTARMIFLSSSVRWLRSGISGCRGG